MLPLKKQDLFQEKKPKESYKKFRREKTSICDQLWSQAALNNKNNWQTLENHEAGPKTKWNLSSPPIGGLQKATKYKTKIDMSKNTYHHNKTKKTDKGNEEM